MGKDGGIYQIKNILNNKIYIGSTTNFHRRWNNEHKRFLKNNTHCNQHLQNAWNKYGEQNFIFEILEQVEDKKKLLEREQYYIDKLKSSNQKNGYNISPTAGSNFGIVFSQETIKNFKDSHIGIQSGEKHPLSILTWKDVSEIRKLYFCKKYTQFDLAKKYNVSRSCIRNVILNKTWVINGYNVLRKNGDCSCENNSSSKLTREKVKEIRIKSKNGFTNKELSEEFCVNKRTIDFIIDNKTWKIDENGNFVVGKRAKNITSSHINIEIANEIRCKYFTGKYNYSALEKEYKLCNRSISNIVNNITWRER